MEAILKIIDSKEFFKGAIFNLIAVLFIYLIPTLSHMVALPLYLIEPMRLVVVLSIMFTSKKNAFLIAITLPVFSFLISTHPIFLKSVIIIAELMLNIFLFYLIQKKIKNGFGAMLISITVSKLFYYSVKMLFLNALLLDGNLISTPIYFQLITMTIYSLIFIRVNEPLK